MNNLREALKKGQPVLGTWLNSGSPIVAEILAQSGFDFVCVDAEHSAVDLAHTQQLFQAVKSGAPDCAAVVRLHGVDYSFVKRYLDAGARGVICPLINTRADAELFISAVKYPPAGNRGVGFCRANAYGARFEDEFKRANDEIMAAVQIEHVIGVSNIEEIVSVPGVDAVFIGPYDLSASMGITAQFQHPEYVKARDRILSVCRARSVPVGIHVVQPNSDELKERFQEGYRLLAYSLDITMLQSLCRKGIADFQSFTAKS
jgi:2-dehydro-3-deoxyglucarate aldolase